MAHLRDERGEILIYGDADQCINLNALLAAFLAVAGLSGASTTVINNYITQITNNLTTQNVSQISQVIEQITNVTQVVSGGTRQVERAQSAPLTITAGDDESLTFSYVSGAKLLSYTVATSPTFIDAGVYAITVRIGKTATAGDTSTSEIELNCDHFSIEETMAAADSNHLSGAGGRILTVFDNFDAGEALSFDITNNDGSNSHTYQATTFTIVKVG